MECKICLFDENVPEIWFDQSGVCNYCNFHFHLESEYPRGEKGKQDFAKILDEVVKNGKGKDFDCILGLSGGTDSTYLAKYLKEQGIRVLAVNFDNGWHSEIAVNNIKKALDKLKIDLVTYVVDWEEMRDIHLSLMKAGLPWPDGATDMGITAALYKVASDEKIKYVFNGHDFRTEGRQPEPWTYIDARLLSHVVKRFSGRKSFRSFPNLTISSLLYYGSYLKIKNIRPFWYLDYSKIEARKILEKELDWVYYGGHHHESIFSRYIIGYWLPQKFGIDKRLVTLSAHIRSKEMNKEEAKKEIFESPYSKELMEKDVQYIIDKFEITRDEYQAIFQSPNKSFLDYPSYYPLIKNLKPLVKYGLSLVLPNKPMMSYDL